jgi:glycosyltransferase, family 2
LKLEKLISVIVPVYNVEEYLDECLDSIKRQTYKNIEVILVNDGSTDKSQEICERYCQQDNRFHLINQENRGLSGARNRGIQESTAEFITFVDSDDIIKDDMLYQLIEKMDSEDIDIVECWYTHNQKELQQKSRENIGNVFKGNGKETLVALCKDNIVRLNAWAKLYRREVIKDFPFPEGLFYEDVYEGIGILLHIRKLVKINYTGYFYRLRFGSIMNREFSEKNLDLFTICAKVEQLYAEDTASLEYIYRRLFDLVLMHIIDYRIHEGNPYKDKYFFYLNRYASSSKPSLLIRLYRLFPKHIVLITRVVRAMQWRLEKYYIKSFFKTQK